MSPNDRKSWTFPSSPGLGPPTVTVIVPAFNAAHTIEGLIDSIFEQDYPPDRLELLIVDDGSGDDTAEIIQRRIQSAATRTDRPRLKLFRQSNQGPSSARNLGLREAAGELAAFTDADCRADPRWVARLAGHFGDPQVIGVGGRQDCPPDASPFMRDVHAVLGMTGFLGGYIKSGDGVSVTGHNPSCTSMYRRNQLLQVGGFRNGLFPGEDVDLDIRFAKAFPSGRMLFDPSAVVFHYRPDSYRRWFRMMWNYGRSNAWNVCLHGYSRVTQVIPWVVVAGIGALLVSAPAGFRWFGRTARGNPLGCSVTIPVVAMVVYRLRQRLLLLLMMVAGFTLGFFQALRDDVPPLDETPFLLIHR